MKEVALEMSSLDEERAQLRPNESTADVKEVLQGVTPGEPSIVACGGEGSLGPEREASC